MKVSKEWLLRNGFCTMTNCKTNESGFSTDEIDVYLGEKSRAEFGESSDGIYTIYEPTRKDILKLIHIFKVAIWSNE